MKSIKWVAPFVAVWLFACSGTPFTNAVDSSDAAAVGDASTAETSVGDTEGQPEGSAASDARADVMSLVVQSDGGDADGRDAAPEGGDTMLDARADAVVIMDAQPDAHVIDAQPDAVAVDASDAGDAGDCIDDLSNIGAGDFHVAFDVMGASVGGTLLSQWPACSASTVHWEIGENTAGGVISTEVGDGTNYTDLTGTISVSDGVWHHVAVARVSATLSITIDSQLDTSIGGAGWPLTTLPSLQIGRSPCYAAFTGQIRNVCITRQ